MRNYLLALLIFAVSVVGLSMGATLPLVSLRLHEDGASPWLIGLFSALPAAGMIIAALLINPLQRRLNGRHLYLGSFAVALLCCAVLEWPQPSAWLLGLARLGLGLAMGILVILGESWVNELCSEARRGQVVALYAACFTGFQLVGPAMIGLFGAASPWLIGLVSLANLLALLLVYAYLPAGWGQVAAHATRSFSLMGFFRVAPALCLGVLFFAFFDSVVLSLFPVYASGHGYAVAAAAFMATLILLGDMLCQVPLGWLSDRLDRRRLHLTCGTLALLLGMALPWLMQHPWLLWPSLALLGAVAGGVYTLALVLIGQDFRGQDLVTANACVGLLWGVGSLSGPLLSGALMGLASHGLPLALSLAAGLFVVTALGSAHRLRHSLPAS